MTRYRTTAAGRVGDSEMKIWVVSEEPLTAPFAFLMDMWDSLTDETTTFRGALPADWELNERVDDDEPLGEGGQAIYPTDHGLYAYDWPDSKGQANWERIEFDPTESLEYPEG